jgi:hypothetical protein
MRGHLFKHSYANCNSFLILILKMESNFMAMGGVNGDKLYPYKAQKTALSHWLDIKPSHFWH